MLNKKYLNVFKNFKLLLTGTRNLRDGLWDIPLIPPTQRQFHRAAQLIHKSNVIIPRNKSPRTLVQYLHAALFSPTKTTLVRAIRNGHSPTWPGFTVANHSKKKVLIISRKTKYGIFKRFFSYFPYSNFF